MREDALHKSEGLVGAGLMHRWGNPYPVRGVSLPSKAAAVNVQLWVCVHVCVFSLLPAVFCVINNRAFVCSLGCYLHLLIFDKIVRSLDKSNFHNSSIPPLIIDEFQWLSGMVILQPGLAAAFFYLSWSLMLCSAIHSILALDKLPNDSLHQTSCEAVFFISLIFFLSYYFLFGNKLKFLFLFFFLLLIVIKNGELNCNIQAEL